MANKIEKVQVRYGHHLAGKGDKPVKYSKIKYDKNYDEIKWKSKKSKKSKKRRIKT